MAYCITTYKKVPATLKVAEDFLKLVFLDAERPQTRVTHAILVVVGEGHVACGDLVVDLVAHVRESFADSVRGYVARWVLPHEST